MIWTVSIYHIDMHDNKQIIMLSHQKKKKLKNNSSLKKELKIIQKPW